MQKTISYNLQRTMHFACLYVNYCVAHVWEQSTLLKLRASVLSYLVLTTANFKCHCESFELTIHIHILVSHMHFKRCQRLLTRPLHAFTHKSLESD